MPSCPYCGGHQRQRNCKSLDRHIEKCRTKIQLYNTFYDKINKKSQKLKHLKGKNQNLVQKIISLEKERNTNIYIQNNHTIQNVFIGNFDTDWNKFKSFASTESFESFKEIKDNLIVTYKRNPNIIDHINSTFMFNVKEIFKHIFNKNSYDELNKAFKNKSLELLDYGYVKNS